MPTCLKCGNSTHFSCGNIARSLPWNNGVDSGLVALFNESSLVSMENHGTSYEDLNNAWSNPHLYFNLCSICKSDMIYWP